MEPSKFAKLLLYIKVKNLNFRLIFLSIFFLQNRFIETFLESS
jgi:hypothetical protein